MRESFLLVRVGGRMCALPLAQVGETLRVPDLPPLASTVPGMRGMTLLRGEQTPVLDLAALLGFTALGGDRRRLVSLRVAERVVAMMVDDVVGVREVDRESLQRIDLPGGQERVMGVFDEGFARVLDAGGLMPEGAGS